MSIPRLPIPGDDEGAWGEILNEYLLVSHTPNGALRVENTLLGKADKSYVDTELDAKADAADLSAKADAADLDAKADSADLAPVATSGSYDDLTDKPAALDTSGFVATSDPRLTDTRTPSSNSVGTAALSDASVTEPKLAIANNPANGNVLAWANSELTWQAQPADAVTSVNAHT